MIIPATAAEAIRDDVLGGRTVRDPAGYLRSAVTAEASRDPALARWLDPPPASCRPSAADRSPSASTARDALDRARHPEGRDPGRGPGNEAAAHRGADRARELLAARRPAPDEAGPPPAPPVYTPEGNPDDAQVADGPEPPPDDQPPADDDEPPF